MDVQVLRIPFELWGREGTVAVRYGPDHDPIAAGFDAIPGLTIDLALCHGYPTVHAWIDEYAGTGYRTFCGWLQIVTNTRYRAEDPQREPPSEHPSEHPTTFVMVDLAPALEACGMPFCSVGNMPQMFDAPCLNLGDWDELRWTADTFLTTVPARSREQEIQWLAGFRWGYNEYSERLDRPVELHPLTATDASAWNAHLAFMRETYGDWRFSQA